MLDRCSIPSLIAPLIAALLAIPTIAQSPEPPAGTPPSKVSTPRPATESTSGNSGPIVNVEFPGGTVRQFVDAVRAAATPQGKVNVIMPKEAESVALPALSLREVTAYTALQAMEFAANQEGNNQFSIGRISKSEETSATFAVRYSSRQPTPFAMQGQQQPPPKQETRVHSIRELVEPPSELSAEPGLVATTETVLNAVKAASQIDSDTKTPPPELMLHKDSMLLIVRGNSDQQRTIESVLSQLNQSMVSRRARAYEAAKRDKASKLEESELRVQLDVNNSQIRQAEAMLAKTTEEVERAKKLHEQGQVSDTELQNLQSSLVGAREALEQAFANRRGLQERTAILEVRRKAGRDAGTGESPVTVIYDFRDLEQFQMDIMTLCREVAMISRSGTDNRISPRGPGTVVLQATPSQHRIIVHALNTIRRAKANEPKLPGLDADDLIRKGEGK